MSIDQGMVKLKKFEREEKISTYDYEISHNNGDTTVTESLLIQNKEFASQHWIASISLCSQTNRKEHESPEEAALHLANKLERLAKAIRTGKFVDLDSL